MKNHKKLLKQIFSIIFVSLMACTTLFATDGTSIMQKVFDNPAPDFSHSAVKMELIDAKGETQTRLMEEWGKDENDLVSSVIIFRSPSTVKNTRFLQVQNEGSSDSKWIYLPALRTVRRIASSEGSKSFMGSDATYDDLETRDVDRDIHEYLGDKTINGYDCYIVKSSAKDSSDSQYSYRLSYIDKNSFVPIRVEMFDKSENLYKILNVEKLEQINNYWIPMVNSMKNVQSGHSTVLTILKIEVDNPLSDKIFTSSFLKTGRL
jgi:hypothetical protein